MIEGVEIFLAPWAMLATINHEQGPVFLLTADGNATTVDLGKCHRLQNTSGDWFGRRHFRLLKIWDWNEDSMKIYTYATRIPDNNLV